MEKIFRAGSCLVLALATGPVFAQAPSRNQHLASQETASRIFQFNQALTAEASQPTNSSFAYDLLSQRASLFSQLIATDPAMALELALPQDIADRLRAGAPAGTLESRGEWQGRTESTIADDFEHHRSQTRWYLDTTEGQIEMFFGDQPTPRLGDPARIRGVRMANRAAVESITAGAQMTPLEGPQVSGTQAACTTLGAQNIAVLMLTMPSNLTFPAGYTQASLREAFFGSDSDTSSTNSLNGFWKEVSYGQTSATGQVFGPFALSQDYTYDTQSGLAAEAIQVADSAVDFTQFTRVALVFPISSWGTYAADDTIGCGTVSSPSKGTLYSSIGWLPAFPNSGPNTFIYDHELGHALGLGHSSSDDYSNVPLGPLGTAGTTVEYGDPFSTMGGAYVYGHYPAEHKSILRWLNPASGYQEVASSGTFTLAPFESTSDPRALRVLRDVTTSAWLWLEYRQPIGDVDKGLQALSGSNVFNGALIHYEDPALLSNKTFLLDFNPTSAPNDFRDAALTPGKSWSDPYSLLTLTANSATPSGLNVTVNYDTPCATLLFSATSFPASGGAGTATVTAPSGCTWTASTSASWITFTGQTSGNGNGVVAFSLSANSDSNQQNGYVTIQRQSTGIVQLGTAMTVLSLNPVYGNGDSGRFTLSLNDTNGYGDMRTAYVTFVGSPWCWMQVSLIGGYLWLNGDSGSTQGPLDLWSPGSTISNSECSVASSGSSISGSGNQLQLNLQMSFFPAFAGAHRVTASVSNGATSTGTMALGTWVVPIVQQPAVTIQANVIGAAFSLDGGAVYPAPVTFYWAPGSQHTITWLTSLPNQTGARYSFQSWADGGSNPRTITVSGSSATYTANILAQYQLTVSVSPNVGGSVTVNPTSADGFYDSGASVTLTAVPAPGYYFWYFSGDASGSSPQTVSMTAVRSVTANFQCSYSVNYTLPDTIGPGPSGGFIEWQTGAGCTWSITGNPSWISLGIPTGGIGSGLVAYSVAQNTGPARSTTVILAGTYNYSMNVTQQALGSAMPTVVSVTPNSGTGATQTFAFQFSDANGFSHISYATITFSAIPSSSSLCLVTYASSGFMLWDGTGTWLGPLAPASTGVLQNGNCLLDGPHSSVSGSGNVLTVTLALTFKTAFNGDKGVTASVNDLTGGTYSYSRTLLAGTWTVPAAPLSAVTIQSNVTGAPFSLEDNSVYQAPITFYWAPGTQHTVTWMNSSPAVGGARYSFRNWADGGGNPRTIVASPSAGTYTGNLSAQYLLTVTSSPTLGGTVWLNPSSADGYYNSGTSVQINTAAASGYGFWYLSGDVSGSVPQSIAMNAPRSVTANFYCSLNYDYWPYTPGPAATTGFLLLQTGAGCSWSISSPPSWLTLSPSSGTGDATLTYSVAANTGSSRSVTLSISYGGSVIIPSVTQDAAATARPTVVSMTPSSGVGAIQTFRYQFSDPSGSANIRSASLRFETTPYTNPTCSAYLLRSSGTTYLYLMSDDGSSYGTGVTVPSGSTLQNSQCSINAGTSSVSGVGNLLTVALAVTFKAAFTGVKFATASAYDNLSALSSDTQMTGVWVAGTVQPLRFVPIAPCRVADTRNLAGAFGGPSIAGGASRDFNIPGSACGVPSSAQAYSFNVAVVPSATLGYLTLWPTGQKRPVASTLNSLDGRVKSNAAIVPAGTGGAVSVFASDTTNAILDIDGYFVSATDPTALAFYPITPCRIADTRGATAPLGGPSLGGGQSRTFPILSSACNLPATAQAYSLNFAAVPGGHRLGYLTAWPSGQTRPLVASLNALTGAITANAAIVPAGANGSIDVFASDATNLVIDINGYFAPMTTGGLSLYNVAPCRVVDTRKPAGSPAITSLDVAVSASACGIPSSAQAHVLSVAVVPQGSLGYLTLWSQGHSRPVVSTLNALDAAITSNLAIVPTTNGSISAFASDLTHLILDISGYFGQ